jgi:hypothetical protein
MSMLGWGLVTVLVGVAVIAGAALAVRWVTRNER